MAAYQNKIHNFFIENINFYLLYDIYLTNFLFNHTENALFFKNIGHIL